ncbi:MAG: hypothetical protein CM1200mP12_18110 [Gammaproteobacteria bacterium]|nr:MAG: hypothetical protein CM1200mP12_18110 [Gammaproteobacteria bacterium]
MAAAKATLLELRKSDAANKMTDFGERLNKALIKTAKDLDLNWLLLESQLCLITD